MGLQTGLYREVRMVSTRIRPLKYTPFTVLTLLLMVLPAAAQTAPEHVTVTLTNGDRLSGSLVAETDGSVTIDHAVLGRITLPREGAPTTGSDSETVHIQAVQRPPTSPWSGSVGLSMNYTDNTKTDFNARLSGELHKKTDTQQFDLSGWFLLQYADGVLTQSKAFVQMSQNWLEQDSPWLTFLDAQYQYNANEAWEHQISPNVGMGYAVYDTPALGLTLKGGVGCRYLYRTNDLEGQLFLRADGRVQLSRDQHLAGFLQLTPAVLDFGNTQGIVQLNYTIKMDVGVPLSTKLFVQNNFDTQPGAGSVANDITVGIGVEYAF